MRLTSSGLIVILLCAIVPARCQQQPITALTPSLSQTFVSIEPLYIELISETYTGLIPELEMPALQLRSRQIPKIKRHRIW